MNLLLPKNMNATGVYQIINGTVIFIPSNFLNYQQLSNSLQHYFREVLGSKSVVSNQPNSGV